MTDTLQPNVLTVDAQGNIGAILAGGVTIPETLADPPAESNAITFVRSDAGPDPGTVAGRLYVVEIPTSTPADVVIEADGAGVGIGADVRARAIDGARDVAAVLIDALGRSSFLQLLSAQKLQVALGNAQVTAAAGAQFQVAHGLGRAPVVSFAIPLGWAGNVWNNAAPDATNLKLAASVALAANFIYWLAIG